jgi:hypothetical protein
VAEETPAIEAETEAESETAGDAAATPKAKGKGKGKGKGEAGAKRKAKGAPKGAVVQAAGPSVAAHPRAARAVARAKAWAGLVGFGLGAYFSLPTGTLAEALARALGAGVVSYVAVWAGAVFIWRRLVILELKGREQQLLAAAQARRAPRELAPPGEPQRAAAGRAMARSASS